MSDVLGYKGNRVIVSGCFSGMGEARPDTRVRTRLWATAGMVSSRRIAEAVDIKEGTPGVIV